MNLPRLNPYSSLPPHSYYAAQGSAPSCIKHLTAYWTTTLPFSTPKIRKIILGTSYYASHWL